VERGGIPQTLARFTALGRFSPLNSIVPTADLWVRESMTGRVPAEDVAKIEVAQEATPGGPKT